MLLHLFPLVCTKRAALAQDLFRNAYLSDVVKERPESNFADLLFLQSQGVGNECRISSDFLRMPLRVVILGVDGQGQRGYRVDQSRGDIAEESFRLREPIFQTPRVEFGGAQRRRKLMQAFANFVERLRTRGEKALEGNAEVSLQDIALPFFAFRRIAMVSGGHNIAAFMLGDIHGCVGDLNQLLGR